MTASQGTTDTNTGATCVYDLTVTTSLVCANTTRCILRSSSSSSSSSSAVNLSPTSSSSVAPNPYTCGYAGYNLSVLSTYDIYDSFTLAGDTVQNGGTVLRLCGIVASSYCTSSEYGGNTAMICEYAPPGNSYTSLAIATWQPNPPTATEYWSVIPNGLLLYILDGSTFSGCGTREAFVYILCNASAPALPTSMISGQIPADANAHCVYTFNITTSLVCPQTGPNAPPPRTCGYAGYDLTPLTTVDLFDTYPPNPAGSYAMRLCGIVTNSYCAPYPNYGAAQSMVCQYTNTAYYALAVATYQQYIAIGTEAWSQINNGLQLVVRNTTYNINRNVENHTKYTTQHNTTQHNTCLEIASEIDLLYSRSHIER